MLKRWLEHPLTRGRAIPFRYLVSGGVSMRTLMPGWTTPAWRALERALQPLMPRVAMFAIIVLRRLPGPAQGGAPVTPR